MDDLIAGGARFIAGDDRSSGEQQLAEARVALAARVVRWRHLPSGRGRRTFSS
jgi:hypothetical protein